MASPLATPTLLALCVSLVATLPACGARSELETGGSGAGGDTAAPTTSTTTTTTCDGPTIAGPLWVAPGTARRPQLASLPASNDVLLSYIAAQQDNAGPLMAGRLSAFSAWPPEVSGVTTLAPDILDHAVGPGPAGPVALVHGVAKSTIATKLYPAIEGTDAEMGKDDVENEALFAAATGDTFLGAFASSAPFQIDPTQVSFYNVVRVQSFTKASAPQVEGPNVCMISPPLGAAVPSGAGFLAAFSTPDADQQGCEGKDPLLGAVLSVVRYDPPASPGGPLTLTKGTHLGGSTDLALLGMAPASFGAWIVYYWPGKPSIFALRVDAAGNQLKGGEPPIAVSGHGFNWPVVAVTSIGDSLVVASADKTMLPAPTIQVQVVRPDGSLGQSIEIDTAEAVLTDHLAVQPSADGQSLLLAWENDPAGAQLILARVDCLSGL